VFSHALSHTHTSSPVHQGKVLWRGVADTHISHTLTYLAWRTVSAARPAQGQKRSCAPGHAGGGPGLLRGGQGPFITHLPWTRWRRPRTSTWWTRSVHHTSSQGHRRSCVPGQAEGCPGPTGGFGRGHVRGRGRRTWTWTCPQSPRTRTEAFLWPWAEFRRT
jgi:hypothetical protein